MEIIIIIIYLLAGIGLLDLSDGYSSTNPNLLNFIVVIIWPAMLIIGGITAIFEWLRR